MQLPTIAAFALTCATLASASWPMTDIIEHIAPGSKTCKPDNAECRTAKQAAPYIFQSMFVYGLYNPNQMAAVIALMALESGEFAYKTNHFPAPGRPGQGTANMQMAKFNLEYAKSIHAVRHEVANVTSVEGLPDVELNRIRSLVTVDKYNFGSGAWFLRNECGEEVVEALRADIDKGFEAYMECVGVEVDDARLDYLNKAKEAFGLDK